LIAVENQLVQAQKMEALGRLAGGVAHDFNNQLTAILGFTQMLLEQPLGEEMERDLRDIQAAADRSAALIRQLLAFGKRQLLRLEPVDLPDLVRNVTRLLDRVLGAPVRCDLRIDPATERILADASQLEHVLTNLAVNARDAMSPGGRLTISTSTIEVRADETRVHASMAPGRYSVLSVADSGHGMDAQTKARIFEPFFTTKDAGQGTGLGLAMVYGIVKQLNGFIGVDSEVGRGTTFRLYFPVTGERVTVGAPAPARPALAAEAARTVLVVEDDRGVREFVARSLRHHGYLARLAESADEAWDVLQEPGSIDLVLLDVVLPGDRHAALMDHIKRTGLPAMFMSGYSEHHVKQRVVSSTPLLEKPFTIEQLLRAVRDALRSSAPCRAVAAPKVASHADHAAVGPSNA
jgi:CheY-like chemotaxis protein